MGEENKKIIPLRHYLAGGAGVGVGCGYGAEYDRNSEYSRAKYGRVRPCPHMGALLYTFLASRYICAQSTWKQLAGQGYYVILVSLHFIFALPVELILSIGYRKAPAGCLTCVFIRKHSMHLLPPGTRLRPN